MKRLLILIAVLIPLFNHAQSESPFWEEIEAFKTQDKVNPPPAGITLFVGSSSIRLWKTLAEDFPQHKVLNRGFGGSTLKDLDLYLEDIVLAYQPRQIVIYCGENDIAAGVSAKKTYKRYRKIHGKIRKRFPEVPVVFISIKPSPSRSQYLTAVIEANRLIRNFLMSTSNTTYVDVFNNMIDQQQRPLPHIFVEDNLHMNATGYQIWQKLVAPVLVAP